MKTIGLIGGMSWSSSALYYRRINEIVGERLGGLHSAKLIMTSVDFADIEAMQVEGRWDDAGRALADDARALQRAGAELIGLATNTMHLVAPAIEAAIDVRFVHLIDVTAEAVTRAGLRTVALLGTAYTMEHGFYADRMATHGITTLVPDADDRAAVHRIIFDELCLGIVRDESRQRYREVMAGLVARGAQGVLSSCTEIELLIGPADSTVPLFATTELHCQALVDRALVPALDSLDS